ncbi:hypothetical protein BA953_13695 [Vibrio coralliilyticus]|nr:hypothetical protein BA953_13695 [Vibrio coralliilyticus]
MSRKGNGWDTGVEGVFHAIKVEAIRYEPIVTREEVRQTILEYIVAGDNRMRRPSVLGDFSPVNVKSKMPLNEVSSLTGTHLTTS